MDDEQHNQRLICAAMYYFDQRDAGLEIRLSDLLEVIDPELHDDLVHLVAAVKYSRASQPPAIEPSSKLAEVIQQALHELRGQRQG